jgi:hypothetical protein
VLWAQKPHPAEKKASTDLLLSLMDASKPSLLHLLLRPGRGDLPGISPSITAHCRA